MMKGEPITSSSMREFKFDQDFAGKIKRLFEEKFEHIQSDASIKTAKLMYKDIQ